MCQQVTVCVSSLWAHGPTGRMMPAVTSMLPRMVEGQLVDTATDCHFVLLCFPQLKWSVECKVCFPE